VTLLLVAVQTTILAGIFDPGWGPQSAVCLRPSSILIKGELRRLLAFSLEHTSDFHLYYNMVSLIYKGRLLEKRFGSLSFAILLLFFIIFSGIVHVALAVAFAEILNVSTARRKK